MLRSGPRPRTGPLSGGLLALLAACGGAPVPGPPRLVDPEGIDPFVLERVQAALSACEEGAPGALLELAKVYDANGLNELALAGYEQCLATVAPTARAPLEYLRAQVLEALGRAPEALAAYDAALSAGDVYAPTHWRRGQLLFDAGQSPAARAAFEAALALEPHSVPANLGLARVELLDEQPDRARERLERLAARVPEERFVHGLLSRALQALGDAAGAERELALEERAQRIAIADPRSAEVRTRATGVLVGLKGANEALVRGDTQAALAELEPLYARASEDLAVSSMLAKTLVTAGAHDRALEVLADARAQHPDQFKLELFTGQAYAGKQQVRRALEHLQRAAALNPAYGPTHAALGELLVQAGRFAEAETALRLALESQDELRTRILLVQAQLAQSAHARALESASEATEAYPHAASAWAYLAEARLRSGAAEEARRALEEAEKRNPRYERLAYVRNLLGLAEAPPR